jgi:hypothetical protein
MLDMGFLPDVTRHRVQKCPEEPADSGLVFFTARQLQCRRSSNRLAGWALNNPCEGWRLGRQRSPAERCRTGSISGRAVAEVRPNLAPAAVLVAARPSSMSVIIFSRISGRVRTGSRNRLKASGHTVWRVCTSRTGTSGERRSKRSKGFKSEQVRGGGVGGRTSQARGRRHRRRCRT